MDKKTKKVGIVIILGLIGICIGISMLITIVIDFWGYELQKQQERPWSAENPAEIMYSGISYRNTSIDGSKLEPLVQEEGIVFYPNTEYQLFWAMPAAMQAEIENDHKSFEIYIEYRFQSTDFAHIWIEVFNPDTGRAFVGMTSVEVEGKQCWKHCLEKCNYLWSRTPVLNQDGVTFSIYTSALPDDGPKVSDDEVYGDLSATWHIAGIDTEVDDFTIPTWVAIN